MALANLQHTMMMMVMMMVMKILVTGFCQVSPLC